MAPALKKLYLFGRGRKGGRERGILSKKTNFGGDGRRYNAFTTFTHFSIKKSVFAFLWVRVDYEVEDRQQKDTLTKKFDRDQSAIILANISN